MGCCTIQEMRPILVHQEEDINKVMKIELEVKSAELKTPELSPLVNIQLDDQRDESKTQPVHSNIWITMDYAKNSWESTCS